LAFWRLGCSLLGVTGSAPARLALRLFATVALLSRGAEASGPPVMIDGLGLDTGRLKAVREAALHYRSVVDPVPLPTPGVVSPELVAIEQRAQAVRLALERARKRESEALWDDCVREAAGAMSDAIEVMASTGELRLLRELHIQTGVCMSLANQAPGARTHFLGAALFDETPPPTGLHREEAEALQAESRKEILARPRGAVRIVTDPPGAHVFIDGREVPGTTPLEADVRLGDHFVTIRRFRFEPNTEQRLLQPFGLVRASLEPARRSTLAEQLAAVQAGRGPAPPRDELELALAQWSRAEELLVAAPQQAPSSGYKFSLVEAGTGKSIRSLAVSASADPASMRQSVCEVLGESCQVSRGIPWYVWPLAGAVVVGGVVTTGVILENNRDTRFCPPAGCR
jgi:hypothetical protein